VKPPVVILCGGRGTRLQDSTRLIPKPLVEVGGRPILWHVINIFVAHGFERFLLLTGYRRDQIERFVRSEPWPRAVEICCVATGEDTPTGGRLYRAAELLDGSDCCLAYADGVADVDLDALLAYHGSHGSPATMTVVRPRLPFGVAELNGDGLVEGFAEKPRSEHWVNGGFFCFSAPALERLTPDSVLEREPLEQLAAEGQLRAFRHTGFWACMDTYKDAVELGDLWARRHAPWKVWE
jgi:glucose-1-phosphate cytidylyltransferase